MPKSMALRAEMRYGKKKASGKSMPKQNKGAGLSAMMKGCSK